MKDGSVPEAAKEPKETSSGFTLPFSTSLPQSVAQSTSTSSSADTMVTSSQDLDTDSTPLCTEPSEDDLAEQKAVAAKADQSSTPHHSPPLGDVASVTRGVAGSFPTTGSDVIASVARIKVMEPLESAGSHSPMAPQSRFPAPIPVTGDEEALEEMSTKVKPEALLPTPTTITTLTLNLGQQLVQCKPLCQPREVCTANCKSLVSSFQQSDQSALW